MREIEFRAYHPSTNEMMFFTGKDFCDQYISHHFGLLLQNKHSEGTDLLMQFTGLKDKNGVKIFEGDIVECAGYFAQIRYSDIQCGFCAAELHDFNCYSVFPQPFLGRDPCEVIGNIHQNPELLEK